MRIETYLFLAFIVINCFLMGCAGEKASETVYHVGVITPLTGEGASYGKSTMQGVNLAVSEINASSFLDKPLEVIPEDDRIDARTGVNALRKLVDVDNVPIVIGPFGSTVVLAVSPIAEQTQTVIISASATADEIADAGDFVFRITPPNSKQGSDVADFSLNTLGSQTAAIIYQNNDYGITLKDAFETRFKELGGEVLAVESAEGGSTDFRTQLSKIKQSQPDVIFFPLHHTESGLTLKQARELGIEADFISADGAMTSELIEIAGEAAEGTYYTTLALGFGVADSLIVAFNENFEETYNEEPGVYAAYAYEVTKLVAEAIKNAGYNAEDIRDYLYSVNGDNSFFGITGTTAFDNKGEVNKSFYVYEVRNKEYVLSEQ